MTTKTEQPDPVEDDLRNIPDDLLCQVAFTYSELAMLGTSVGIAQGEMIKAGKPAEAAKLDKLYQLVCSMTAVAVERSGRCKAAYFAQDPPPRGSVAMMNRADAISFNEESN